MDTGIIKKKLTSFILMVFLIYMPFHVEKGNVLAQTTSYCQNCEKLKEIYIGLMKNKTDSEFKLEGEPIHAPGLKDRFAMADGLLYGLINQYKTDKKLYEMMLANPLADPSQLKKLENKLKKSAAELLEQQEIVKNLKAELDSAKKEDEQLKIDLEETKELLEGCKKRANECVSSQTVPNCPEPPVTGVGENPNERPYCGPDSGYEWVMRPEVCNRPGLC